MVALELLNFTDKLQKHWTKMYQQKNSTGWAGEFESKYARILLFQFVFTKYVFNFRNYDGRTFVVIVVFYKNVIGRNYDKILRVAVICRI